jgi:hypothetical protein
MNITNFMISLLNVPLWVNSISHKGYVCSDPCSNQFRISHNVVFFENQGSTSHAVVGEVVVHLEHVLDLFQMKTCRDVEVGRMAVDCFELERQPPRSTKMTSGSPLDSGKVRKMKKGGFFSFWRLLVKWVWAAVKPKFPGEAQAQTEENL